MIEFHIICELSDFRVTKEALFVPPGKRSHFVGSHLLYLSPKGTVIVTILFPMFTVVPGML